MSEIAKDVDSKYSLYREAVKNHNHALKKLNHFYENYLNIPESNGDTLNKTVVDASGKSYYITPQGVMKQIRGGSNFMSSDCPNPNASTSISQYAPSETLMNGIPLESNQPMPETKESNYYIGGKPMSLNQPCSFFNQETSINLPDKSTNRQMKTCTYVFEDPSKSNMVAHDDMKNSTLEECRVRAEDVGHDAFGIVKANPNDFNGTCYTGKKEETPIDDAKRIEISEIITTNKSNTTLTLLRNGNLIMWSPDSDNSNYYNDEKVFQEQVVLWSSKGQGGKTDERCDPVFGGAINNINVTYGTNCGLNLF